MLTAICEHSKSCSWRTFCTLSPRIRRRRVSNYKSYHRREEIKYNRSEWCRGKALAFKSIGRGFAPRQHVFFSDVGDAFDSWPRRIIYPDATPTCRSLSFHMINN